jgi:hypothetical protein
MNTKLRYTSLIFTAGYFFLLSPKSLPLVLLPISILLLSTLTASWSYFFYIKLLGGERLFFAKLLTTINTILIASLLTLSSIGQLTLKDFILLCLFFFMLIFYFSRILYDKSNRE